MNIPFVVETVLHDGLLKYKFKNSKIRSITTKPGKSKGAIFAYRSKKSMIGGRGVVLTSEEAIHENQDTFTHWTPNVYRYGTYADENRSYTKGHSENNLRQINTFFIDFDIHTEKETISASDILTTAIDLGFMPTLIIKSDKGYQAYFVLETPVYVTSKSEFKSVKAAKIISQNIREYFGKSLPVDLTCNHFGIARIPRTDNVEFFDPNYRYSFKEWQDWSFKQTDNKGFTRSSLTVLSGTEGKKQVDEPWFNLLLHETKFSGEKGLVGRNSVMFTLSLAYFSSGYSIETCEYNMFLTKKLGFEAIRENYRKERDDWKLDLRVDEHTELEIFAEKNPPKRVNRPEACGLRHLAFRVASVEETVKELDEIGIECEPIRTDTYTGEKMTFFFDPDGLPLEIHE